MPRAKTKNAPGLEILLHPPQDPPNSTSLTPPTPTNYNPTYRPGNVITGTVTLTSTSDVPIGSVDIKFYARAKVKIVQSNGDSATEYRSRANFFTLEQTLFEGGYTFKPGTWAWPFTFTCPNRADAQLLRGGTDKKGRATVRFKPRGEDFLNTQGPEKEGGRDEAQYKEYVSEHTLPATMNYYHGTLGRQAWAYVEYVLVTTLTEPESGGGSGMFKKSPRKRVSTRALTFVTEQKQDVIKDWGLTTETHHPTIRSSRLITAAGCSSASTGKSPIESESDSFFTSFPKTNSNTSTSTPEVQGLDSPSSGNPIMASPRRSSSFFSRLSLTSTSTSPLSSSIFSHSSIPRLTLTVTVTYPTIIQVAHPTSIPFSINIAPDTSPGATTLSPDRYPSVLIKSFTFILVCCTKTRVTEWKRDEKDAKTVNIKVCENKVVNKIVNLAPDGSLAMSDVDADVLCDYMSNSAGRFEAKGKAEMEKGTSLEQVNSPTPTALPLSPSTTTDSSPSKTRSFTPSDEKSSKTKAHHLPSNDTNTLSFSSASASSNLQAPPGSINLGSIASLSIQSAKLGHITEPLLTPTFSTYNILRNFGLKYSIDLEVLTPSSATGTATRNPPRTKGESIRIKGEVPKGNITVIGIADSIREQIEGKSMQAGGGGAGGLPDYDALSNSDQDSLSGRIDDDDAENEELVENMARLKAREARDEKNVLRRREGGDGDGDGRETRGEEEEVLPRYSR